MIKESVCRICCGEGSVIYHGPVKTGELDGYTEKEYDVWQCKKCGTIWNYAYKDEQKDYYSSGEYRSRVDGDADIATYCAKYDREVLEKLNMTGTGVFRNKVVCDIGCGGGSFLDFLSGVAGQIVGVEPTDSFRSGLKKKGYDVYPYASDALADYRGKCDVVTSFDVIEHVDDCGQFVKDIYNLLGKDGTAIVGTPTDYPVLRRLLGDSFNKFIFQVQHPWVLSRNALEILFEEAGFTDFEIEMRQKYGLGNLIAWLSEGKPRGDIKYPFISETIDATYRQEMGRLEGEYLVVRAKK